MTVKTMHTQLIQETQLVTVISNAIQFQDLSLTELRELLVYSIEGNKEAQVIILKAFGRLVANQATDYLDQPINMKAMLQAGHQAILDSINFMADIKSTDLNDFKAIAKGKVRIAMKAEAKGFHIVNKAA
ncbi:hypothetical protein N9R79_03985 [Vibrio sp.]|nr:hypothetical protein [Vibrio sp.]